MTEERERSLAIMLVVALIVGVGFDFVGGVIEAPERLPVPGERIVEQTSYCPPPVEAKRSAAQVTLGAPTKDRIPFSLDPQMSGELMHLRGPGARNLTTRAASAATGYGTFLPAAATTQTYEPVVGAGAARCSRYASTKWFFPEGSSLLGFDEKLILFNPFPDEAVASVTFSTPTGELTRARLAQGVAVAAGKTRVLALNRFVQPQSVLAAAIQMQRGRVIAWRSSLVDPKEQPAGLQFTLGARNPATTWYLPAGSVEEGIEERISIYNPSRDEAVVNVSLITSRGTLQPPKLVDVKVPPLSAIRLPLSEYAGRGQKDLGGAGVVVHSTNDVGVVAERSLWYMLDAVTGVSSEIGSAIARREWLVPPALLKPSTDTLVFLNPGPNRVKVNIAVLRDGRKPYRPKGFQGVVVAAGARRRIELSGNAATLWVSAGGPIVAERSATSARDAAAVMGFPLGDS